MFPQNHQILMTIDFLNNRVFILESKDISEVVASKQIIGPIQMMLSRDDTFTSSCILISITDEMSQHLMRRCPERLD